MERGVSNGATRRAMSAMNEMLTEIDMQLERLDYQVEHIVTDFMKVLDRFDPERHWSYTMSSVRRIAASGVRAFARVYAREAGETFRHLGLMRYLFVEAVRRWLQSHVNSDAERMMWIKVLSGFRDMEKQVLKDSELATDNLWQYFEIEAMKKWVQKMDEFHVNGYGTSWRDNLAAHEVEHLPWVRHEVHILRDLDLVDPDPFLSAEELEKFAKRVRIWGDGAQASAL